MTIYRVTTNREDSIHGAAYHTVAPYWELITGYNEPIMTWKIETDNPTVFEQMLSTDPAVVSYKKEPIRYRGEKSVWTRYIGARQARDVARALNAAGYRITAKQVREIGYVLNLGAYLEPGDIHAREEVYGLVCQAAGFQPGRGMKEKGS